MSRSLSIGEQIIQHGLEHEKRIKQKAIDWLSDFYRGTEAKDYAEKFRNGAKEHGELTLERLQDTAWEKAFIDEAKDAFWYMAILDFIANAKKDR